MSQDKIGTDQWVSSYENRIAAPKGLQSQFDRIARSLPLWAWFLILFAGSALLPLLTTNNFVIRIGANIALMAALGLGLNLVVGYAGLLDLGFIAFYGIGAYAYAYLSSEFTGLHWDTGITLILVTIVTALFGLLLGLPSLRLIGDYLAIVTLGFGQMFVQLTTSMTRVNLPGLEEPVNLTGGPNGIPNLDSINIFGFQADTPTHFYYIFLVVLALILVVVFHLKNSRLGRAWRALREDELAAEAMGMPTRRLKLQVFAIGAAIAGLCGGLFASFQGAVFPGNFDITLLITIYAIIVLGGLGSIPGVLIGAVVMMAVPDILRNPELAGTLFYLGILVTLFAIMKPRWQIVPLFVVLYLFAGALTALLGNAWPDSTTIQSPFGVGIPLAIPPEATDIGNLGFGLLIILVMIVSRLKNRWLRFAVLIPTLYVLAFVWETRLSQEPSVTRLLFVGLLLIVLMIYRPNGILGRRRVEVV
jgi:ABC-type branched-subunit amino acid transport system permease subunit